MICPIRQTAGAGHRIDSPARDLPLFHVNALLRIPSLFLITMLRNIAIFLMLSSHCLVPMMLSGCGASIQRQGTEQLLLSDSVDQAIDQLDLSGLAGRRVYLDTEYMKTFKGNNVYINSDYIISALRQKMTTTGCQIETNRTEADYVLEARVGALGTDTMEVTLGIPSSNGVGAAASAITGAGAVPAIPEISFGKKNGVLGVSKVVVFAYHRETGVPVWQSGAAIARTDARDSWMFGIGPLTRGSVYDGVTLAGNRINPPFGKTSKQKQVKPLSIADRHQYVHPAVLEHQLAEAKEQKAQVEQAGHEQSSADASAVNTAGSAKLDGTPAPPSAALPPPPVPPAGNPPTAAPVATPPK